MSKIYIEVFTPGNGKRYEMMLDDRTAVSQAMKRILEEITDYENGQISFGESTLLFNLDNRKKLIGSDTLRESPVSSGQTLLLV